MDLTATVAREDLQDNSQLSNKGLPPPTSEGKSQVTEDGDTVTQVDEGKEDGDKKKSSSSPPEGREQWDSKTAYFLTLIGFTVGFGNVWRFPFLVRENGGMVFFIPYFTMMAVFGVSCFLMELAVGQRRRKGTVSTWMEISPRLGGIGIACGFLCFLIGLYYNTLTAYCLSYFVDSFRSPLPWASCATVSKNKTLQDECQNKVGGRSSKFYWYRGVLDVSPEYDVPGNYSFWLLMYLLISWVAIFLILIKGTKSVGVVVYITAVFPYVGLGIFFIANLCVEPDKGWLGAYRLLKPDWTILYQPITWLKAGSQVLFTLNLGFSATVVVASYCPVRNNCHRDATWVALINSATSILAVLVVFPMIGALGHRKYDECVEHMASFFNNSHLLPYSKEFKYDIYFQTDAESWSQVESGQHPIQVLYGYGELTAKHTRKNYRHYFDEMTSETFSGLQNLSDFPRKDIMSDLRNCSIGIEATASGGGTGFVFQAFTEAVLHMPGSNFWSVLFFLMLLTLGIDSGFGLVECVITAVVDVAHVKRSTANLVVCGVSMILSILLFPFGWGIFVLDLLDQWAASWTLVFLAIVECIAVSWEYGLAQIAYDVRLMTGKKPHVFTLLCWKYLSPLVLALLLLGSIGQFIYGCIHDKGFTYGAFQPSNNASVQGDLRLFMPPYIMVVGFLLIVIGIAGVPVQYCLQKRKWQWLKEEPPAEFPEEELRQERNIQVTREEDLFTNWEKRIIGAKGLKRLQENRDRKQRELEGKT